MQGDTSSPKENRGTETKEDAAESAENPETLSEQGQTFTEAVREDSES